MTLIATGDWEVTGDTDWFSADLVAGQSYVIELIGPDGYVFQIFDPSMPIPADGEFGGSAYSGSSAAPGHFTAGADVTFYFSATGLAPGDYTIRITEIADDYADNAASTGTFHNGLANGRFEAVSDSDWFGAHLKAGQAYRYGVVSGGQYEIRIVDENGNLVDLPPLGADGKGVFVPDVTGNYEIVVVSIGDAASFHPVNYSVTLDPIAHVDDWGHTAATAGTITLGGGALPSGSATGNWELAGDKDWFAVHLDANHTYSIKATGAGVGHDYAGSITIVDANGVPVSLPGDLEQGGNNGTSFTPATSGTYYVQMDSDAATGGYSVNVAEIVDDYTGSAVRPGIVTINGSASGAFEANNDIDWFRVNLVAGQSYSTSAFQTAGNSTFFGYATFLGPDGFPLGQTFTATTTGVYYVQAIGFTDAATPRGPNYNLSVQSYNDDYSDNAATTGHVTVGGQVTGKTEIGFDEDWFKVTLEAGKSYVFTATGSNPFLPTIVQVLGPDGLFTGSTNVFTAETGGTYYISVTGYLAGNYTLSAAEYPDDYGDSPPVSGQFVDAPDFDFDGVQKSGTTGSDTLGGTIRGDLIQGLDGDDRLSGKAGSDFLDGGRGKDRMVGGTGDDSYVVDIKGDKVIENAGEGHDTVASAISYTLGDNVEALTLTGTAAIKATGNALDNQLTGNVAANVLDGGLGSDVLTGGGGRDMLSGGAGADTFRFLAGDTGSTSAAADRVTDFSHAAGDRIDLSAIDAKAGGGNDAFTFIGGDRFDGHAGQLRFVTVGGDTFVQADIDGDKTADLVIRLDGAHPLVAADFML